MHDAVRAELVDLLRTGGRNLCTMPRVLLNMLRDRCPADREAVEDIGRALDCGAVDELLKAVGPIDTAAAATRCEERAGLPTGRAKWVIDSWAAAIDAADATPSLARGWSAWNQIRIDDGSGRRTFTSLIFVAVAGAVGGTGFGWFRLFGGSVMSWTTSAEGLPSAVADMAAFAFGILGGFLGGAVGWMAGGGRITTDGPIGKSITAPLVVASSGGLAGATVGAIVGAGLGIIGPSLGALVGAFGGQFLALAAAEVMDRFRR